MDGYGRSARSTKCWPLCPSLQLVASDGRVARAQGAICSAAATSSAPWSLRAASGRARRSAPSSATTKTAARSSWLDEEHVGHRRRAVLRARDDAGVSLLLVDQRRRARGHRHGAGPSSLALLLLARSRGAGAHRAPRRRLSRPTRAGGGETTRAKTAARAMARRRRLWWLDELLPRGRRAHDLARRARAAHRREANSKGGAAAADRQANGRRSG